MLRSLIFQGSCDTNLALITSKVKIILPLREVACYGRDADVIYTNNLHRNSRKIITLRALFELIICNIHFCYVFGRRINRGFRKCPPYAEY